MQRYFQWGVVGGFVVTKYSSIGAFSGFAAKSTNKTLIEVVAQWFVLSRNRWFQVLATQAPAAWEAPSVWVRVSVVR